MLLIKVGLEESQIIGNLTPRLKYELKSSLSYQNQGQIIQRNIMKKRLGYIPKHLKWSGTIYLYNETKNTFPTGLLKKVKEIIESHGENWSEVIEYNMPQSHQCNIVSMGDKPLRFYQIGAIDEIKNNMRGIIRIGTGGGKTIMAINAAAEICQLPFLFVVNRVSLLKQAHKDFEKFLNEKIGFIGDGQMSFGRFNIATVHTLCSILNIDYKDDDADEKTFAYTPEQIEMLLALLKETRMVVVDECHHAASDMYRKLMKNLPNAIYRIGLSATPFRTDGLDLLLTSAFGDVLYNISASELIRLKYLVKPYIRVVLYEDQDLTKKFPTEQKSGKRKANYNAVYKECVVENQKFNLIVAKLAIAHAKVNEQVLISVKQVTHGENILKAIKLIYPDAPVEFLHGKNKKELGDEAVIKRFTERKTKILISTLFDEGVDIPAIDVAIDAGGGISPIKMLQLVGRAIRLNEGKERATIYVFAQPYTHLMKHSVERINILKTEEEFVIQKLEWDK